jgi:hypothetical protein
VGAPSARVMYERLKEWELPDWLVYPSGKEIDKKKKHKTPNTEEKTQRKVRDTGDANEELPSPEGAMELFDKDIERLQDYMSDLPYLVERRQGKQFLSSLWIEDDVEDYLDPRDYSEAKWKEICEAFNLDPGTAPTNLVKVADPYLSPREFGPTVTKKLAVMINVHALIHGSVDRLLEVLHPRPNEAARKQLYEKRDHKKGKKDGPVPTLLTAAKQIALLVRSAPLGGTPPPRLSRHKLWTKWNIIDPMHLQGRSDQEIFDYLNEHFGNHDFPEEGSEYSLDEVTYLRGLNIPKPSGRV